MKKEIKDLIVRGGGSSKALERPAQRSAAEIVAAYKDKVAEQQRKVRLRWLVDKTSSMSSLIGKAKEASREFFRRATSAREAIEVSWGAYGDYCDYANDGPKALLELHPLTSDTAVLERLIAGTQLVGGGDVDEAIEYALASSLADPKSHDAIVLIGDADPHPPEEARRQADSYGLFTQWSLDWEANARSLGEARLPVYTFPMTPRCRPSFERIARLSGGEVGDLDDLDALLDLLLVTVASVGGGHERVRELMKSLPGKLHPRALEFATRLALPPGERKR